MRTLSNAPPAERRAFQLAERRRLLELQDKEAAQGPIQNVGRTVGQCFLAVLPLYIYPKILSTLQTATFQEVEDNIVRMPAQRSRAFNHVRRQN